MRRKANDTFTPYLSPLTACLLAVGLAVVVVFLDLITGAMINLAIFKTLVLMVTATARRRAFLWAMAIALVITTYITMMSDLAAFDDPARHHAIIVNRSFNAIVLLLVTGLLHIWIGADAAEREAVGALEERNKALAERDERIGRQNEELQSQTEELERQSEELRVSNDELAQRERMLETMLDLSRSLHVGLSDDETMQRICETLVQLVKGPAVASAILIATPDGARVRCQYGFGPTGIQKDLIPTTRAFSKLVIEQRRTGFLEDLALRPELEIPQPTVGEPMVSVLATPLMVNGQPIGTVELYSREKRNWGEEQVTLIESLAAQTSISLENAALFEQIDEHRRRLKTIIENVPIGMLIVDASLTDVRFNGAGAALIGVAPDTNLAKEFGRQMWLLFEGGKQLPLERYPSMRAIGGERVYPHEVELLLPTGRRLTVMSSAAPFFDAEGRIVGAVSSFVDITQLKALQRELESRRREAEEANVRKTRFLAAASHDIRTPANAISLLAELLKRTADNPSMAGEIPQLSEELRNSANSLVNLVSNVLDVTRFDTDKIELHESEFSLATLLDEEARQVLPLAQAKKLILDVEPAPGEIWVRADRIKLGRVMGNLLGNAIKFTDNGGIRVTCAHNGGPVEIRVSDTGIGIPPENQSRIFDEFFQLSEPDRSKGSGLGLAISKRLIEAMGGAIKVDSEPGRGSTFKVTIPRDAVVTRPQKSSRS